MICGLGCGKKVNNRCDECKDRKWLSTGNRKELYEAFGGSAYLRGLLISGGWNHYNPNKTHIQLSYFP